MSAGTATPGYSRGNPVHIASDDSAQLGRALVNLSDALAITYPPLGVAARVAHELGNVAATGELLALLDPYQPGYLDMP